MNDKEFDELKIIKKHMLKKCKICNGMGVVPIGKIDSEWITTKDCECIKKFKIYKKYYITNIPKLHWHLNFRDIKDETTRNTVIKYAKKIKYCVNSNINIFLTGNIGSGKTMIISLILKYILNKTSYKCKYFVFDDILDFDKMGDNNMDDYEVLAIDDIGSEHRKIGSDYAINTLNNTLNKRFNKRKLVLISSKFSLEKIKSIYSEDVTNIIKSNCLIIKLQAHNYNDEVLKSKIKKLME